MGLDNSGPHDSHESLLAPVYAHRKNGMVHCNESAPDIQKACRYYLVPSKITYKQHCAHYRSGTLAGVCDSYKVGLWVDDGR